MTTIYCARFLFANALQQIDDGAIAVDGSTITAAGPRPEILRRFPDADVMDLGDAAIIPGLVNCHTHIELTAMRGYLERQEGDFFAWLTRLTIARLTLMTADDIYVSAAMGAIEAARAGITSIGDASDSAGESMRALNQVGLRATVYQECFQPDPRLADETMDKLRAKVDARREHESPLVRLGVSPHAPYSVCGDVLSRVATYAIDERLPVMMHAAESEAERLFVQQGTGPFAEGLASREIEWRTPGTSTIKHLDECGILQTRPLLAHCITVDSDDIKMLARSGASVAHCPKSNAKLGHGRAPLAAMLKGGVTVGLGSDSVASNNTCDILEEARFAALVSRAAGDKLDDDAMVGASEMLRAATTIGAKALGLEDRVGQLAEGMQADFAVISLAGGHQQPIHDAIAAIVFASSGRDIVLTVVAGKEIYRDGRMATVDEVELRMRMKKIEEQL